MTKRRITPSGTYTYTGYDAENHLNNLELDVAPLIPNFISEVNRKVCENTKPKNKEEKNND